MANHIQWMMYEGFLAADPDSRFTDGGNAVTNFRIGSTHQYRKGDEVVKETTWIKVVAWGKLGEIVNQYCAKGSHVVVIGRLRPGKGGNPDTFTLKSGDAGASFEMTATEVRIIKGKSDAGESAPATPAGDEDFPF